MKAILFVLALAGTAAAEPATYSIDFGSQVRWLGDTSAAILSPDPLAGPQITLGRSLTRIDAPYRTVDVSVFGRFKYATGSGTLFQNLDTTIDQYGLAAGLRFEAPLIWRLRGVGQAELGYMYTGVTITQDTMTPVDDSKWTPYGAASLGGDFRIVDNARFKLSLGIDLGYLAAIPAKLRALPADRPDSNLSIATTFASLGHLDTRGVTYSASLRGAF